VNRPQKHLRGIFEASLALFAAGCPPSLVAQKFHMFVSYPTIIRWYHNWAEMKGVPNNLRLAQRKERTPRHIRNHELTEKNINYALTVEDNFEEAARAAAANEKKAKQKQLARRIEKLIREMSDEEMEKLEAIAESRKDAPMSRSAEPEQYDA
jgi:hypothetical protein